MRPMPLRVLHVDLNTLNMRTRMPFKYGIATLTALPHLFVRLLLDVDGVRVHGLASDGLPPKWFTKDPDVAVKDEIDDMIAVVRHACDVALGVEESDTVFDLWQQVHTMQAAWAMARERNGEGKREFPPLLWGFGVSLVERAAIDAFCRAKRTTFASALRSGALGMRLEDLHAELQGIPPASLLPAEPLRRVIARHTVGLADPLIDSDIPPSERLDDSLPQSLESCIEAYGLTHFKIKLSGDAERDIDRLRRIAAIVSSRRRGFAFTLDGNECHREAEPFRTLWRRLSDEPALRDFLRGLLFVEQPFHRQVALSDDLGAALLAWRDRPPIIIDESDGEIGSAARALGLGYVGTSFKNCKGVFKGVANACMLQQRRVQAGDASAFILSGEDLANVGPVAMPQDLCVAANLGITHVERNGHHYFRGLGMFTHDIQAKVLAAHPNLYRRHTDGSGFATLNIVGGVLDAGSVVDAPFGVGIELDTTRFTPIDQWRHESLN